MDSVIWSQIKVNWFILFLSWSRSRKRFEDILSEIWQITFYKWCFHPQKSRNISAAAIIKETPLARYPQFLWHFRWHHPRVIKNLRDTERFRTTIPNRPAKTTRAAAANGTGKNQAAPSLAAAKVAVFLRLMSLVSPLEAPSKIQQHLQRSLFAVPARRIQTQGS